MELDIISFDALNHALNTETVIYLKTALLQKGIVGIRDIPEFERLSRAYIQAARQFAALTDSIKNKYTPNRDLGKTKGYELGAEWFKNKEGTWQTDDKKASFYAFVPDSPHNIWPLEVDLKSPYLALGELIFTVGKIILNLIGLQQDNLRGNGRMLHYHQAGDLANDNPYWCGAHFDHGILTGLIPAYYFCDGVEIEEPADAGLHIVPSDGYQFEKINASDKSVLLFQVGEFGQLISNDHIKATQHLVRKAKGQIERFTFALFYSGDENTLIQSSSILTQDDRYKKNQFSDGSIRYKEWQKASYDRYRVKY